MTRRRSRRLSWHAAAAVITLSAILILAAACGGSSSSDDTGEGTPTATSAATSTAAGGGATATATATPTATPTADATEEPAPAEMAIRSSAFAESDQIPLRYTCDGANVLPPLEFINVPAEAVTLAIVIDDPDAPGGTWDHWIRFNVTPSAGVSEAAASTTNVGTVGTAGTNSFGNTLYGGPCPPDGSHRYVFKLFALDAELALPEGATSEELADAVAEQLLAQAELVGRFERPPVMAAPEGLATTPVIGRISNAYKVLASGQPTAYDFDELPFEPGTVEAHWYQAEGRYVVVYRGIDAGTIGPLCPGNSIQTANGFLHVSNAPNEDGGCIASVPAVDAGVGVLACGEHLVYHTAIPTSVAGNLFGTVEAFDADDSLIGVTSAASADPAAIPPIDLAAFCAG